MPGSVQCLVGGFLLRSRPKQCGQCGQCGHDWWKHIHRIIDEAWMKHALFKQGHNSPEQQRDWWVLAAER